MAIHKPNLTTYSTLVNCERVDDMGILFYIIAILGFAYIAFVMMIFVSPIISIFEIIGFLFGIKSKNDENN